MRRSKEEIIAAILEVCLTGVNKTAIVHKCNLNFNLASTYLNSLVEKGFISVTEHPCKTYKTTDKGKEILKMSKALHDLTFSIYGNSDYSLSLILPAILAFYRVINFLALAMASEINYG